MANTIKRTPVKCPKCGGTSVVEEADILELRRLEWDPADKQYVQRERTEQDGGMFSDMRLLCADCDAEMEDEKDAYLETDRSYFD